MRSAASGVAAVTRVGHAISGVLHEVASQSQFERREAWFRVRASLSASLQRFDVTSANTVLMSCETEKRSDSTTEQHICARDR